MKQHHITFALSTVHTMCTMKFSIRNNVFFLVPSSDLPVNAEHFSRDANAVAFVAGEHLVVGIALAIVGAV